MTTISRTIIFAIPIERTLKSDENVKNLTHVYSPRVSSVYNMIRYIFPTLVFINGISLKLFITNDKQVSKNLHGKSSRWTPTTSHSYKNNRDGVTIAKE